MKILIVDDHVLFREGLASLLKKQPDIQVVGEVGCIEDAVTLAVELNPDIVLMGINNAEESGVGALRQILLKRPDVKVVILTVDESDELLFAAIRNGAKGYLPKSTPLHKLLLSLHALQRGEAAISRTTTSRLLNEFSRIAPIDFNGTSEPENLTSRELEVLSLLGEDITNREIANRLVISENTVKIHVHNILEKLQVRNRREAGRFARRQGLLLNALSSPAKNNHFLK